MCVYNAISKIKLHVTSIESILISKNYEDLYHLLCYRNSFKNISWLVTDLIELMYSLFFSVNLLGSERNNDFGILANGKQGKNLSWRPLFGNYILSPSWDCPTWKTEQKYRSELSWWKKNMALQYFLCLVSLWTSNLVQIHSFLAFTVQ